MGLALSRDECFTPSRDARSSSIGWFRAKAHEHTGRSPFFNRRVSGLSARLPVGTLRISTASGLRWSVVAVA